MNELEVKSNSSIEDTSIDEVENVLGSNSYETKVVVRSRELKDEVPTFSTLSHIDLTKVQLDQ